MPYTLRVDPQEVRGVWEGWGTSLSWWGVAVGDSPFIADALWSLSDAVQCPETGVVVAGLGLNIMRYNVGACGRPEDGKAVNTKEVNTAGRWFKTVEGFWINWLSKDPSSQSFDWTRDVRQRQAADMALQRGVVNHVELFYLAPMWWMTHEKTSFGGALQKWNHSDYVLYAVLVAEHMMQAQRWPVRSLEILNEPSSGWWKPGIAQEGFNATHEVMLDLLQRLQAEVRARPLLAGRVRVAGVDENYCAQASATCVKLPPGLVQQVNVHGYNGGAAPNRNCDVRRALRQAVAPDVPLWVSEYGDNDPEGLNLAHSITEDFTHLRPTVWAYWQAVEARKPNGSPHVWGLLTCHFGKNPGDPQRGTGMHINGKYHVFAQFTRFLRPGMTIIGSNDHNSVCAYDTSAQALVCVTLNWGKNHDITVDLSKFASCAGTGTATFTNIKGAKKLATSRFSFSGNSYTHTAEPFTVYSLVFDRVLR